jgi:hypothetical protein
MAENKRNIIALDPQKLRIQATYKINGLTVTSNDRNIIPRDAAGNIILQENVQNPLLIIEPVATKITTDSVLKVLDTRFNYYKFPVTIIETASDDLDLSIDTDILSVELKLPVAVDDRNQPAPWEPINTSYSSDWFYSNGFESSGFRELPFTGGVQPRVNAYTLTKSTIDSLKLQNKTLKFTIQTQFVAQNGNIDTGFVIRINRDNVKSYRPWLFPIPEIRTLQTPEHGYPVLGMEFILNADDFVEDDVFTILAVSGNPAYSLNDKAYWKIEAVDIPKTPPLFGIDNKSGVYNVFSNGETVTLNSVTYDSTGEIITEIGRKEPGSVNFIKTN